MALAYLGWRTRTPSSLGPMKLACANAVRTGLPAAFSISSRIREPVVASVAASGARAGCRLGCCACCGARAGCRRGCCAGARVATGCGVGGDAMALRAAISRDRGDDASPKRSLCPKMVMAWSI